MTLKDATKVVLMAPVPWFAILATVAYAQGRTAGLGTIAAAFAAIYGPALGAFVTGTSIKRGQELRGQRGGE